ncbi:hypothetical protein ACDX66_02160 [Peribacillus frigoritolerans]
MRQLGCLELKDAKIHWRAKTNKEDRPPCKITMELMAKAFTHLYYELLKKGKPNDRPWLEEE